MFIVNNSLYLSISNQVSYKEKKYGRWIPRNSLPFIWHENLDYFLEVCQEAINSFIDDCVDDTFEDLDEIRLDYLYKLNFPDANILAKKNSNSFCHLLSEYNDLLIFIPFFYHNQNLKVDGETFLINPIKNIYIKDNQIVMEGFGHFIKDRDGYYYNSVEDFLNKENLNYYHSTK